MKKIIQLLLIGIILSISFSCDDSNEETDPNLETYQFYSPNSTMSFSDLRNSVSILPPRTIGYKGKIYMYGDLIFINEFNKGIHVINNANPYFPRNINFIKIFGNTDMAVKDNILYANSFIDLVCFNIEDINNIREVNRLENVFVNDKYILPEEALDFTFNFAYVPNSLKDSVVIDWKVVEEKYPRDVNFALEDKFINTGGSMASFLLNKNVLYTIESERFLQPFDVTIASVPEVKDEINIGFGIETLFSDNNHLFIGSRRGMFIYDITDPLNPNRVSLFEHAEACDPVFVKDTLAFVTLRTGTICNNGVNELKVVNVKDIEKPVLLATHEMFNPHGLYVKDKTLFLCEAEQGLKIFNVEDIDKINENLIKHYDNMHAYDVIVIDNRLVLIGNDGLFQYEISNLNNIQLMSKVQYLVR